MSAPRYRELLDGYFDRALAPEERAELEAVLRDSAEARAEFWEEAEWQALLRDWAEQAGARAQAQRVMPARAKRPIPVASRATRRPGRTISSPAQTTRRGWAWSLALLVVAGALLAWQWPRLAPPRATPVLAAVESVADAPFKQGAELKGGPFELRSGVAQLRFAGGATMVVQAPARMEITGRNEVAMRHGRVLVEAAGGFVVVTPQGRVRDLGTRFGVAVRDEKNAEAHVFEGRVEMSGETLTAGQALAVSPTALTRQPADARLFPQPARVLAESLAGGGFEGGNQPGLLIPDRAGVWSGDRCEVTGPSLGIRPHAGAAMLRFVRADAAQDDGPDTADASEQWQFVDLAPLKDALPDGARAEFSAWFNRIGAAGATDEFVLVMAAYGGSIEEIRSQWWPQRPAMTLAYDRGTVRTDADPGTWQRGTASVAIPPGANYLLVNIGANKGRRGATLSGHFADSVSLKIVLPPRPISTAP